MKYLLSFILLVTPLCAELIPALYLTDWNAGTTVGVPGGIDQYITGRTDLIDVTLTPYFADNTGATDAEPAIQSAMDAATSGQVVYLPAGTYRIEGNLSFGAKDNVTLRGAGMDVTIVEKWPPPSGQYQALYAGSGSAWNWGWPTSGYEVTGGGTRDSDTTTMADTSDYNVGDIIRFESDNQTTLPVVDTWSWGTRRESRHLLLSKTSTTLTFDPPLFFDLDANPTVRTATSHAKYVGFEDLTVDSTNCTAAQGGPTAVYIEQGYGCWVKNVKVTQAASYSIYFNNTVNCEIRECYINEIQNPGTNGAGILIERSTGLLVEDNIVYKAMPLIEVNYATVGSVFAYNFLEDSQSFTVIGAGINANHGPHNSYNLYEGNIVSKIQSDGYHGSASEDTIFRNWAHGTNPNTVLFAICININRLSRNYNLVANVLGVTDYTFNYDNAAAGVAYEDRYIYTLGLPNVGNGGHTGTAQHSLGDEWDDWADYLANLPNGTGPTPNGWQELDLDVDATTIRKGNWNAIDEGIRAGEVTVDSIPDSYFRTSKPAYFEGMVWPPIGPERIGTWSATEATLSTVAIIPAQARYYSLAIDGVDFPKQHAGPTGRSPSIGITGGGTSMSGGYSIGN